jgi:hypothetical protein
MLPNAGGLVYGTIVVATLLATESARSETYGKTIGAVVVALLTYWLVITYSQYAGERLEREPPSASSRCSTGRRFRCWPSSSAGPPAPR